jgi:adenylate cyclase
MSLSDRAQDQIAPRRPIPRDVRNAIAFMREALDRSITMGDLAGHCGIAERTLTEHFRTFLDMSPMRYLRRLRLAAAREALLSGRPDISVTGVAAEYGFTHPGRFAAQYRQYLGESPSATLRNAHHDARSARGTTGSVQRAPLRSREAPSIAVLPCRVSSDEPVLARFAETIAEEIAAALCSIRPLSVTLAGSRGAAGDPVRWAREAGARYVLAGRVAHGGERLRCILRLVDSAAGHLVWGASFDGARDEPFGLQDRIVAGVARAVPPAIRDAEIDRAWRAAPRDLDAHGLAMRALPFVFQSRPDATRHALEFLHRAMEIDPDFGLATALAAWCHGQLVMYNGTETPAEETLSALRLVRRAAILDDGDPLVLSARVAVHTMAREFDTADALARRALRRDPTSAWAWGRSGWLHSYRGESRTAIAHFRRALSLASDAATRANSFAGIGSAYFDTGRYKAAATWLRKSLQEQPDMSWPNRSLSVSYARLGHRTEAAAALNALRRYRPDLTVGEVVAAVPFRNDFLSRLGDGLSGLGLPP